MDKINQDLTRLTTWSTDICGTESFSPIVSLKDFTAYYCKRFVSNIRHAFSVFTLAEIQVYNDRYSSSLQHMFKRPLRSLSGIIVPIPRAMVKPYHATLQTLSKQLTTIQADHLTEDVSILINHLKDETPAIATKPNFDKVQYDQCRIAIGELYAKVGLTHALATTAVESQQSLADTNTQLLQLTHVYYPIVIALNSMLKQVENLYAVHEKQHNNQTDAAILLSLAYRLSILATVMNHVQDMEHSFTQTLDIIRNHSNQ